VARVEVYDAKGRRLPLAAAVVCFRLAAALDRAAWGSSLMDALLRFGAEYGRAPLRAEGGRLVVDAGGAEVLFEEGEEGEVRVTAVLKMDLGDPEQLLLLVARLAGELERLDKRVDAVSERLQLLERRLSRLEGRLERLEWAARLEGRLEEGE
jgi:hypothetical protein